MTAKPTVTVIGGTGFVGRVVAKTLAANFAIRIAARNPPSAETSQTYVQCDVRDPDSVCAAVQGTVAVVNAVGLYQARQGETFSDVHIDGAGTVAHAAAEHGATCVHISGIGVDADIADPFIQARRRGEQAVLAHGNPVILRPSVMFGEAGDIVQTLDNMSRFNPLVPLFGRGDTRLQPLHVEDLALAIVRLLENNFSTEASAQIYELGGADTLTYRQLVELVLRSRNRKRLLVPVPWAIWRGLARAANMLPNAPLTPSQVELMRHDNVANAQLPGTADLGLEPRGIYADGIEHIYGKDRGT